MSMFSEIRQHKFRFVKTVALFISFVIVGLVNTTPGATLLDLQIAVDTSLHKIPLIITARSLGYLVGAILFGFIIDKIDLQIVMVISLFACTALSTLMPWNRDFYTLCVNMFANGLNLSLFNIGGNTWLIHMWGKATAPFMQALHFSFAFGSFIAPLLSEPFLLPLENNRNSSKTNFTEIFILTETKNETMHHKIFHQNHSDNTHQYTLKDLKIVYPYSIIAGISLFTGIFLLILYLINPDNTEHPSRKENKNENGEIVKKVSTRLRVFCTIVASFLFLFSNGLDLSFGSLLSTYAVKCRLQFSKSAASFLMSVFWATFTFSRCFIIFIVDHIGLTYLMLGNIVLIILANVILDIFGTVYAYGLWVGVAIMGLGLSSIFGSILAYLEQFMNVSSQMTSTMLVFCCIGDFILPSIIGTYISKFPDILLLISGVSSACLIVLFITLFLIRRCHEKKVIIVNNNNTIPYTNI